MRLHPIAILSLLAFASTAQAADFFSDDFNANTAALNSVPTGWTVTDGTVDIIDNGYLGITCVSGKCIDLDGSTSNAGVLSKSFDLLGGTTYTLSFYLSGNQRRGSDNVEISFGSSMMSLTNLAANAPYSPYDLPFTPGADGSFAVSFANAGGDNWGAMLDNVSITTPAVPEASTWAMMILGLAGITAIGMRRRRD